MQIDSGEIVAQVAMTSANLEARLRGIALASQDREFVVDTFTSVLRLDLDHSGSAVTVRHSSDTECPHVHREYESPDSDRAPPRASGGEPRLAAWPVLPVGRRC